LDGDWEFIKLNFDLKKKYLGNPFGTSFIPYGNVINDPVYDICKQGGSNSEIDSLAEELPRGLDMKKIVLSKEKMMKIYSEKVS
jgi:hypothetical protein